MPDTDGKLDLEECEGRRRARRSRGYLWSSLLWLGFPIADLANTHPSALTATLSGIGLATFVVVYLGVGDGRIGSGSEQAAMLALAGLAVDASLLTTLASPSMSSLFIFIAACGGLSLPGFKAGAVVLACTALCAATTALGGGSAAEIVALTPSTLGVGGLMVALGQTITANEELRRARADLARLAVAEERLRFGRDLHDLLGHSLSVIAVKAQLARRLMPDRSEEAAEHLDDLQTVARQALAEVREAVSGYRLPTLAGELAGARMALEAAGIEAVVGTPSASAASGLSPDAEALLAWTVREGTTNVIRHSAARRCTIVVAPAEAGTSVEVRDDGAGANGSAPAGHGLVGLRERAERIDGRLDAGAAPGGGFRLRVSVPGGAREPAVV
jgi:two-component system sensor histidine kinase DesK